MTNLIIETSQLCKSFENRPALRGLDLRVPVGSIFGFLGRNGAGKTTTIKTLMGLLRSDSGSARVFGTPVIDADRSVEIRRRIGFVTEDKELYPYMTVEQIIRFTRPFFPKWRDDLERRYLKMFELPPKRKIPDLSKGMRSKLMLLLAISRGAELLILDEPTDGLDPAATEDVLRELVAIAASSGTTMFFSSHQLAEVELIADHIGIIDQGRMIVAGQSRRYESSRTNGSRWCSRIRWNYRSTGWMASSLCGRRGALFRSLPATMSRPSSSRRNPCREPRSSAFRSRSKRFSWNT